MTEEKQSSDADTRQILMLNLNLVKGTALPVNDIPGEGSDKHNFQY